MAKQNGNKGGRPRKVIDWEQVDKLLGIHCTKDEICAIIEVDEGTLSSACKRERGMGFSEYSKLKKASGKASLRRRQYLAAVEQGNTTMLIWLGKQWLGQSDKPNEPAQEHTFRLVMGPSPSGAELPEDDPQADE